MSADTVTMTAPDATALILRAHKDCTPGQMFREVPVNSFQAGATKMRADTFWPAVGQIGVHYRTFEDDGCGMLPDELPRFLNAFGGSGKTIGIEDENYGIGFKTSALPENRAGVVVLALKDHITSMMWLWTDPNTGQIGARRLLDPSGFESTNDFHEAVAYSGSTEVLVLDVGDGPMYDSFEISGVDWADPLPQWIKDAGHGSCFVMLGNHYFDPTEDPSKFDTVGNLAGTKTKYGMLSELNARFWSLPLPVELRSYPDFTDRSKWPTSKPTREHWRLGEGLEDYLNRSARVIETGEVEIEAAGLAATAYWFIFARRPEDGPRPKQGPQRGDRISEPFLGALYESHPDVVEVMDLATASTGAFQRMKNWIGPTEVIRQIGIIVVPNPEAELWQDGTRTMLRYRRNGNPSGMPWAEWGEDFAAKMPPEIRALVDAFYAKSVDEIDGLTDDDYKRLGDKFGSWMRYAKAVLKFSKSGSLMAPTEEDPKGGVKVSSDNPDGPPTTGGTTTKAKRRKGRPASMATYKATSTTAPARSVKEYDDLPHAVWGDVEESWMAMEYDPANHRVVVNQDHLYWKSFTAALVDTYRDLGPAAHIAVIKAAEPTWLSSASLVVAHQMKLAEEAPDKRRELLEPMALNAGLAGIRNHLDAASGPIGKAIGAMRKKKGAA